MIATKFLGEASHQMTRRAATTYPLGIRTDGAETVSTIKASIQALTGKALERLPEGQRARATHVCYTHPGTPLQTVDLTAKTPPDLIEYLGQTYEVIVAEDWTQHTTGLPHYRSVLALIGEDEDR